MFLKTHRPMNEAVAAEVGGAGAPTAPADPAPAPAASAPAPAPAAPTTIMSKGAAAAAPASPHDWISDKFRVTGDDGAINIEASAKKMAEAYGNLEKRFGAGDVPPADVSGYKVAAPEQYAELLKDWNPSEDQALQSFLTNAHQAGMTQKQIDLVIGEYGRVMSQVQGKVAPPTPEQQAEEAAKALGEVWKDPAEFEKNVGEAFKAGQKLAAKLGVDFDEFNAALGNNPMFLRLAAKLNAEMAEDVPQGTQFNPADALDWDAKRAELTSQRDALPAGDPRRAQIVKQLDEHYKKRYPG